MATSPSPFQGESWRGFFKGRTALLATMHHKEAVIAPVLQTTLEMSVQVLPHLNTDEFGTFTRDVPRAGGQRQAARLKAQAALARVDATLAIASEGAFFPYPPLPWVACDRELVLLLDQQHGLEIVGEVCSTQTNYAHRTVSSLEEAAGFAQSVGFPDHGLIAMTADQPDSSALIFKGLRSKGDLADAVKRILSRQDSAHLETDMRALHNPTRMKVIEQATHQLVKTLQQCCPQCHYPGFRKIKQIPGLPCEWCRSPTLLVQTDIYHCHRCHHQVRVDFPEGQRVASPAQCAICNP
ncbi:MAG: DUF6671 family protein [Cyanobacteria bacterium P01_G01_bin.38]